LILLLPFWSRRAIAIIMIAPIARRRRYAAILRGIGQIRRVRGHRCTVDDRHKHFAPFTVPASQSGSGCQCGGAWNPIPFAMHVRYFYHCGSKGFSLTAHDGGTD
jgi:hypothetical protein